MPEEAMDYRRPIEQDEGSGLLFRNGAFVAPVRYTLVTVENAPTTSPTRSVSYAYTGVVRFEPSAFAISQLLGDLGQSFSLETTEGRQLTCLPTEPLDDTRLRWIVRLS